MSALILLAVALLAVLWGVALNSQIQDELKSSLRNLRVSIITPDGGVNFDNMADPATMENHADREEIQEALSGGVGQGERVSSTLGERTYYYAERLTDGRVLRLSLTTATIYALLWSHIPLALLCLLLVLGLAFLAARRLSARVIAPINAVDLDNPEGIGIDELAPFARKIEQQRAEIEGQMQALKARASTIQAITESMKEGLILVDEHGVALSANQSAAGIFGARTLVGKPMIEVCRDLSLKGPLDACLAGEAGQLPLRRGGRVFEVYLSPVQGVGAAILFLDQTDKHEAERQRREFSANVSHELKTPLTTILGLSEMIGGGMAEQQDVPGFGSKIHAQAQRLLNIIDDIIRLSAFDEGVMEREFTRFDARALAESVLSGFEQQARQKGVSLELAGSPVFISANRRMMDELLTNLVDNAIKYNVDGGRVLVRVTEEGGDVVLAVQDSGIGIERQHQSRVFERFYRVDKSRSQKTGGTGLGLSIVKHVVEFHQGETEIRSEPGKGTEIICRMPLAGRPNP